MFAFCILNLMINDVLFRWKNILYFKIADYNHDTNSDVIDINIFIHFWLKLSYSDFFIFKFNAITFQLAIFILKILSAYFYIIWFIFADTDENFCNIKNSSIYNNTFRKWL
jgi:hypothetical protein